MSVPEIDYEVLHKDIEQVLKPKGEPVGVKFFKSEEEFKKYCRKPFEKNIALCQAIKIAAVYGRTLGLTKDNVDACVVGTAVLGMKAPPPDLKERWVKGFAYDPKIFDLLVSNVYTFKPGEVAGVIMAPLKTFKMKGLEPDIVVLIVNSAQAYLALVGYFDATGKKPVSDFNGHAACEVISAPLVKSSPWLTIPCGGARAFAEAQDDELWMAFKPEEIKASIDRLKRVGLKYPPPVIQMVYSEPLPEHPLTYLVVREPKS